MPNGCEVPFCLEKKGGHKFPNDETLLKQWLVAIRREDFTPIIHSRVCRKHFNPDDYTLPKESFTEYPRLKLKPNAVPSQFAWNVKSGEEQLKKIKIKRGRCFAKCQTATLRSSTDGNHRTMPNRCTNCGIDTSKWGNISVVAERSSDVQNVISSWIHPRVISESDGICSECLPLAEAAALTEGPWLRQLGNKAVCVSCCTSVRMKRKVGPLPPYAGSRSDRLKITRAIAAYIAPRKLESFYKICCFCWNKVAKKYPSVASLGKPRRRIQSVNDVTCPQHTASDVNVKLEIDPLQLKDEEDPLKNLKCKVKRETDEYIEIRVDVKEEIQDEENLKSNNDDVEFEIKLNNEHNCLMDVDKNSHPDETDLLIEHEDILNEIYDEKNRHLLTMDETQNEAMKMKGHNSKTYGSFDSSQISNVKDQEMSKPSGLNVDNDPEFITKFNGKNLKRLNVVKVLKVTNKPDFIPKFQDKKPRINNPQPSCGTINLPHIKRAPASTRQCIFKNCSFTTSKVPNHIRESMLKIHKFYIPEISQICSDHLKSSAGLAKVENLRSFSNFTAEHIEDMLRLKASAKSNFNDFESFETMLDHMFEYWTGMSKEMFSKILTKTKLNRASRGKTGLAALLIKLRTDDTDERLSSLFQMQQTTMATMLSVAKKAIINREDCITMICSTVLNKHRLNVIKSFFAKESSKQTLCEDVLLSNAETQRPESNQSQTHSSSHQSNASNELSTPQFNLWDTYANTSSMKCNTLPNEYTTPSDEFNKMNSQFNHSNTPLVDLNTPWIERSNDINK